MQQRSENEGNRSPVPEPDLSLFQMIPAQIERRSLSSKQVTSTIESIESDYHLKINSIRKQIQSEKKDLLEKIEIEKNLQLADLYAKEEVFLMKARKDYTEKKHSLLREAPVMQECSSCSKPHKIPAAQCIECKSVHLCDSCLQSTIIDSCKCSNCATIVNIICTSCQKKKRREVGWFEFDSCRAGCGYLCPDHSTMLLCQSCGHQCFCDGPNRQCVLNQCGQCKLILCSTCKRHQGCFCQAPSSLDDPNPRHRRRASNDPDLPLTSSRSTRPNRKSRRHTMNA